MFPFVSLMAVITILMGQCHAIRNFPDGPPSPSRENVTMIAPPGFFTARTTRRGARVGRVGCVAGFLRLLIMWYPLARRDFVTFFVPHSLTACAS
jgi:peptidoglycan biosynthesis protein MviN/MurJ (putative lipid II flippase)